MAAATVFEALTEWGRAAPTSTSDLARFVRGPLRDRLIRRTDGADVEAIVLDVLRLLSDADAPTGKQHAPSTSPPPADRPSGSWSAEGPTTASVEMLPEPVPVLVVASSFVFAYRLEAALGPIVVRADTVDDVRRLRAAIREMRPRLVVVDAIEAPMLEPAELAEEIALPGIVCVVWAREMAYGRRVVESLESLDVSPVSLTRKDGIDPLLDLVKSRRA